MRRADHAGAARGDACRPALHQLRLEALSGLHLIRRFFGALGDAEPAEADEAWVASILGDSGSHRLWCRMPAPDRRHAVGVAHRVADFSSEPAVVAAALLHDVGKVASDLGTFGRVPATLAGMIGGRGRASSWAARPAGLRRRVGAYLCHDAIGAALLSAAGADPLTVAWAREHHLPPSQWTVPRDVGRVLKEADDD
ncbi:MAG: hypothetical protein ACYDH6_17435 [Acidimicrobiales bacterium]